MNDACSADVSVPICGRVSSATAWSGEDQDSQYVLKSSSQSDGRSAGVTLKDLVAGMKGFSGGMETLLG